MKLDDLRLFSRKIFQRLKMGVSCNVAENWLSSKSSQSWELCIWRNSARITCENLQLLFLLHYCMYKSLAFVSWLSVSVVCSAANSSPLDLLHSSSHTLAKQWQIRLVHLSFYFIVFINMTVFLGHSMEFSTVIREMADISPSMFMPHLCLSLTHRLKLAMNWGHSS